MLLELLLRAEGELKLWASSSCVTRWHYRDSTPTCLLCLSSVFQDFLFPFFIVLLCFSLWPFTWHLLIIFRSYERRRNSIAGYHGQYVAGNNHTAVSKRAGTSTGSVTALSNPVVCCSPHLPQQSPLHFVSEWKLSLLLLGLLSINTTVLQLGSPCPFTSQWFAEWSKLLWTDYGILHN